MDHRFGEEGWESVQSLREIQRTKTPESIWTAEGALGNQAERVSRGYREVICFLPSLRPRGPSRCGTHQSSSPFQDSPSVLKINVNGVRDASVEIFTYKLFTFFQYCPKFSVGIFISTCLPEHIRRY